MSVAIWMLVFRSYFFGSSYTERTMATQRLPLFCRATNRLSPDVHRLVQEYLTVRVGKKSAYIDDLLRWQMQHRGVDLNFRIRGRIPPASARRRPSRTWALTLMRWSLRRTS